MDLSELNNLDFNNAGAWPLPVKIAASALIVVAVATAGWYFDWKNQSAQLEKERKQEITLRSEFEEKQKRAANLEAYEAQLAEMRSSFGEMLRQLPSKAEVAQLLVDISQTGLAVGLEFDTFKPQSEVKREFYSELPVNMTVRGSYSELSQFVSGISNLPRIVTVHNISIKPTSAASNELQMALTAKTYWYQEEGQ